MQQMTKKILWTLHNNHWRRRQNYRLQTLAYEWKLLEFRRQFEFEGEIRETYL